MSRTKIWLPLALAGAIAAAVGVGALRRPHAVHSVSPVRKDIAIASARVEPTDGGPVVRLDIEIAGGTGIEPASVREMMLYRVAVDDVQPMKDHGRGIFSEPLGWSPERMAEISRIPGPAGARQVLVDNTVVPGQTYAYRVGYTTSVIGSEHLSPIAAVRVHPTDAWWPSTRVASEAALLAGSFPDDVRIQTVGRGGHRGLPILSIRIGTAAPDAPSLVLVGAVHAGESGPELILPALRKLLERSRSDAALARALGRIAVLAVPVVNVDERDRLLSGHPTYLRLNPQGIDLNRNFPSRWEEISTKYGTSSAEPGSMTYRGPAPLSAIEAKALYDALAQVPIAALLSYHGLYSLAGSELQQPEAMAAVAPAVKERLKALGDAWFAGLGQRPFPDGVKTLIRDASPGGSLVTWVVMDRGAAAFEVEAAGDPRLLAMRDAPPTPELLEEYQDRHASALAAVLVWLAAAP